MVVTLQTRNTITIPQELRRALKLEPGAPLDIRVEQGSLVLTPVAVVPRTLHLSSTGEAKEAEAEADVRAGRVSRYEDEHALLEDLAR